MELIRLRSLNDLLAAADRWNELWQRSQACSPAARAESLAAWLQHFASDAEYELLVVADAGNWTAALPLMRRRIKGLCPAACLPCSPWWNSGELLLDEASDAAAALDALALAIARQPQPLLWLDAVRFNTSRWQAFISALERAGLPYALRPQSWVGQVEIEHDWDAYQQRWSRSHRRQIKVAAQRAEKTGGLELSVRQLSPDDDVSTLVRQGFEIEHRSWKGRRGSSVLSQRDMLGYYCEQARRLAANGHAELVFLEHNGDPIAFEYGISAKGTYFSYKVGYDERFAAFSPGQLLRAKLLEQFHADPGRRCLDFAGPLCQATARWCTRAEPVGRLVAGTCSLSGKTLAAAYRLWMRAGEAAGRIMPPTAPEFGVAKADRVPAAH